MTRVRHTVAKLVYIVTGRDADRDFDEEVQIHLALLAERFAKSGMSPEAAHAAAYRQFGHRTTLDNDRRDLMRFVRGEAILQDLRFGLRRLRRQPFFTGMAVSLLALGIGANTAVFSMLEDLLIAPLAVRNPHELALIALDISPDARFQGTARLGFVSLREFLGPNAGVPLEVADKLRRSSGVFSDVMATSSLVSVELGSDAGDEQVLSTRAAFVTTNYFTLLGVGAAQGRILQESGRSPVAILSDGVWQQKFGRRPDAIGRVIRLNGIAVEIVGIAPSGFDGITVGSPTGVWLPLHARPVVVPGAQPTTR